MRLSEKNFLILQFIQVLGILRKLFRLTHIEIEKLYAFHNIDTTVSPFLSEDGSIEEKASLSFFLDAEAANPIDEDKQSLGVSLTIRYSRKYWIAEGEIGWTGATVGWDNYIEREYKVEDIDVFIDRLPIFVTDLLEQYKVECNKEG